MNEHEAAHEIAAWSQCHTAHPRSVMQSNGISSGRQENRPQKAGGLEREMTFTGLRLRGQLRPQLDTERTKKSVNVVSCLYTVACKHLAYIDGSRGRCSLSTVRAYHVCVCVRVGCKCLLIQVN